MSKKIADLCVVSGRYTDLKGNEKCKYENIGVKMVNQEGREFLLLKPFINLAGFINEGSVLVSVFPVQSDIEAQNEEQKPVDMTPSIETETSEVTGERRFDIF